MPVVDRQWVGNLAADTPADGTEVEGFLTDIADTVDALDDDNIANGANINGSKLLAASIPAGSFVSGAVATADIAALAVNESKILHTTSSGIRCLNTVEAVRKMMWGLFHITAAGTSTFTGTAALPSQWNGGLAGGSSAHTITFSVNASDYDSAFDSATNMNAQLTVQNSVTGEILIPYITGVTTSTIAFTLQAITAGGILPAAYAPTGTIIVHFVVIGEGA